MLQPNSKEERIYGDQTICKLNQINKSDEDPLFFLEDQPIQTGNDLHPTHQPEQTSTYGNFESYYYQIDGFFDLEQNAGQRIMEVDRMPFEAQTPKDQMNSMSFSMSEVADITMTNLDYQLSQNEQPDPRWPSDQERLPVAEQTQEKKLVHTSEKNIMGYIAKKSIKIVLKKYKWKLMKACKQADIQFRDLSNFYSDCEKEIYGPEKIAVMLRISERDDEKMRRMKEIFYVYFVKVLRRHYLIDALKKGKMSDIELYLCRKNKHLLYFSESISV